MDKRKRFQRTCQSCGRIDIVRSDQLHRKCKPCQMILGGMLLESYVKANPESCSKASRKHGMHNTRLYRIHASMMERCGHKGTRHKWAMYYEDRGIKVCEDWRDRAKFFAWALENGYADNLELDRIDNDKGYSPDNCRWVTHKENQSNRRNSRSNRWSMYGNCCKTCLTDERPHVAKGLCSACYQRSIYISTGAKKP